jgi:hypothetical protein
MADQDPQRDLAHRELQRFHARLVTLYPL